jgi:hypothetical protein
MLDARNDSLGSVHVVLFCLYKFQYSSATASELRNESKARPSCACAVNVEVWVRTTQAGLRMGQVSRPKLP